MTQQIANTARSTKLPTPKSLSHQHLFACINTALPDDIARIRILDAGCGDGRMMSFLHHAMSAARPNATIEAYGFDVVDHGVQDQGFLGETVEKLSHEIPEIDWSKRVKSLHIGDKWDFSDGYFDAVVSNQVLEHVADKHFFFQESHRVLRDGGVAVHLAPLRHVIFDLHLNLPLVHRIRSFDLMHRYIAALSLFGLGKFRGHRKKFGVSRREFSTMHADYIIFNTSYASEREVSNIAISSGFRPSYRFTRELYSLKLRQKLGRKLPMQYRRKRSAVADFMSMKIFRYVSSITLVCEKMNTYRRL